MQLENAHTTLEDAQRVEDVMSNATMRDPPAPHVAKQDSIVAVMPRRSGGHLCPTDRQGRLKRPKRIGHHRRQKSVRETTSMDVDCALTEKQRLLNVRML